MKIGNIYVIEINDRDASFFCNIFAWNFIYLSCKKIINISCWKTDVGARERSSLIKTTFIDKLKYFRSRKFKRGLLGRYGTKSGVNPGIAWPTEKDLDLGMTNRNSDLIWVFFSFFTRMRVFILSLAGYGFMLNLIGT